MGRAPTIDSGDTAWMLVSTALVMLMLLPGLALFYGGLVRAKNLLSVMSQAMGIAAIAILSWVGWNYSLAFGGGNMLIGNLAKAGLAGLDSSLVAGRERGQGDPRAGVRGVPDDLRGDHRGADHRRPGRARALFGDDAVRIAVADDRLRPAGAHGVGVGWVPVRPGRDRLRRRHGGAYQFGHCRPGRGRLRGPAHRAFEGADAAPFAGADHDRRGTAVGRMVRLQRRLGARGERAGRSGDDEHVRCAGRRSADLDGRRAAGLGQALDARRSVGRGRRPGRRDARGRSQRSDRSDGAGRRGEPDLLRLRRVARRTGCGSTTASTCSGSTGSAGSPGRWARLSSRFRRSAAMAGRTMRLATSLVVQLAAVGVAIAWSAAGSALCFAAVKAIIPLRRPRDEEREGLDIADHGERAYSF